LRVAVRDRHAKSPKGLRRMTDLCGVLHGQMAKVEQKRHSRKFVCRMLHGTPHRDGGMPCSAARAQTGNHNMWRW
jgi:hypothetical protein